MERGRPRFQVTFAAPTAQPLYIELVDASGTIRDLSDTGARIAFPSPISIPDRIELFIPQKNRTYSADVRRRDDCEVGIAFRDQRSGEQRRETDASMSDRVAALEHEVAQLRRIVKQLRDKVLPHETDV